MIKLFGKKLIFRKLLILICLLFFSIIFVACKVQFVYSSDKVAENFEANDSFYKNDDNNSIKYLYITIPKDQGDKKYTFSDLDNDKDKYDDYEPEMDVIFQEGTENGLDNCYYGQGITESNATFKIRGSSTRNADKKSFKIKLDKKAGLWNGNRIINLNKHPYDNSKLRNKLSFDYFKKISDIVTLRTQFVNVYIKDLNKPEPDQEFVNFGLFTQIEEANEDFLANRGLDPNGNLYKANFFEFWPTEQMVNVDSPDYNEQDFERCLEIKAGNDHSKMLSMVADVMDESIDINEVIDKHFNRDNYLTWLAANIIMGNIDTGSQNYYLYSPTESSTWYFIPWDYDGAWRYYNQNGESSNQPPWQKGITNYGGVVLTRRFLTKESNVEQLKSKVDELSNIITADITSEMLNGYFEAVKNVLSDEPDRLDLTTVKKEIEDIVTTPEKNIKNFYESLKIPMPVFTGNPEEIGDNKMYFPWNESYCPCGGEISYSLAIARDLEFQNTILSMDNIIDTNYTFDELDKGTYFFKLTIKCIEGYNQVTYDTYVDENGIKHYGVRKIVIE